MPDYIAMMMWSFALKEAAFWLNRLSLRSDGHSCEATFFSIDKDLFNPTTLHVLGHLALFLIPACNQELLVLQNGNQDLG
jgi:hypothetical protein